MFSSSSASLACRQQLRAAAGGSAGVSPAYLFLTAVIITVTICPLQLPTVLKMFSLYIPSTTNYRNDRMFPTSHVFLPAGHQYHSAHRSPLTQAHHSVLTSHCSPLTSHLSPLTSHLSPPKYTSHHPSPPRTSSTPHTSTHLIEYLFVLVCMWLGRCGLKVPRSRTLA